MNLVVSAIHSNLVILDIDFRTGHRRAGEHELDVPAPEADGPVRRRAGIGHMIDILDSSIKLLYG